MKRIAEVRSSFIFMCVFVLLLGVGCREQILHNLPESEANKVLNRLHRNAIRAEKIRQADGRWMIAVERRESMPALASLERGRFLKEEEKPRAAEGNSLMNSRESQRFTFERSLSSEIARTLEGIEGVIEARVHLNLPRTDPLFGGRVSSDDGSGSVVLLTGSSFQQDKTAIAGVVSGASGVAAGAISVLIAEGEVKDDELPPPASPMILGKVPDSWLYTSGIVLMGSGTLALLILARKRNVNAAAATRA